ncbi:MAG: glycoside hydrolase family 5 protein [Oscillospiraceae bacterium]|nr:glycoside hydrolase family 5 protein [Oscillospiraceae bacterium]
MTEFNVCFDGCTVKEIKIYDNRSPIPKEVSGNTASQLASKMGKAWNLGNALDSTTDGVADETLWNNKFPVSKPMFDTVRASGFDTVRMPVSYMDKIVLENGKYTVDDTYMARVKQVVDVAIASGLYVVIDVHNDGGANVDGMWLDITKTGTEFNSIENKFSDLWTDIAVNFADYDQKLIFEGFNELNNGNYNTAPTTEQLSNVNTLNNTFVEAVRNAGGTNTDRVLIVAGSNTNIDYTVSGFAKPNDTASDRLMLSVHYYELDDFALNETGTDEWDESEQIIDIMNQFDKISLYKSLCLGSHICGLADCI